MAVEFVRRIPAMAGSESNNTRECIFWAEVKLAGAQLLSASPRMCERMREPIVSGVGTFGEVDGAT